MSTDEKIEMRILQDQLNAEDLKAVEGNVQLRQYKEVVDRAMGVPTVDEPPRAVDMAILAHAKQATKKQEKPVMSFTLWYSVAATLAFLLVVGVAVTRNRGTKGDEEPRIVHLTPHEDDDSTPQHALPNREPLKWSQLPSNRTAQAERKKTSVQAEVAFDWDDDRLGEELALISGEVYLDDLDSELAVLVEDVSL